MPATSTSRAAYTVHKGSQAIARQSDAVLEYIRSHRLVTRREIEDGTGIRVNAVCGRCAELLASGLVEKHGTKECRVTGNRVEALRVVPAQAELMLEAA